METKKIESFEKNIKYFINLYNNTTDALLKEEAKETVKDFVNYINVLNPSKRELYINMLKQVDLSEEYIKEIIKNDEIKEEKQETKIVDENTKKEELTEEYKEALEYVNENVLNSSDSNLKEGFEGLLEQLEKDMKSPNETLIETWINNYKDFVQAYELDEQIMYNYVDYLFKHKYEYNLTNLEQLYDKKEEKINSEETENITNEAVIDTEDKEVENVVSNDNNVSEEEPAKENEEELKSEDNNNDSTTNDVENTSDDKEIEGIITKEPTTTNQEKDNDVESNEPLKIINMEKSSKLTKHLIPYGIAAILLTSGLSMGPILGIAAAIVGTKINNTRYRKKLQKIIDDNNLDIRLKDNAIIDKATKQEINVDKARYENIKKSLIKIGAIKNENSKFSWEYIKNNHFKRMVTRVKGYFAKRAERLKNVNNAETLEEREKYKYSKIAYENDEYIFKFKEEQEESRGMSR